MMRIHFTPKDLSRVTVADGPVPMIELVLSARLLSIKSTTGHWRRWREMAVDQVPDRARPVQHLIGMALCLPDFLTPPAARDFRDGVAAVVGSDGAQIAAEMADLRRQQRLPRWTRDLAAGTSTARHDLGEALTAYHQKLLDPIWDEVSAAVATDRGKLGHTMLDVGVENALARLHPAARWTPPVLEISLRADSGAVLDLHLRGRGLVLAPSYFARGPFWMDPVDGTPVLCFPVEDSEPTRPARELAALLGPTRAAVLANVTVPGTTSQLAQRVGVSVASASQHASVLREAGLLTTQRFGGVVLHTLTGLGRALVDGDPPPD